MEMEIESEIERVIQIEKERDGDKRETHGDTEIEGMKDIERCRDRETESEAKMRQC